MGCPTTPPVAQHLGPDGATSFLELGTGENAYEPLTDGGTIELVHGPQGGYHVLGSCRIFGLDPDGRIIHYVAASSDGVVLAEASLALMTRVLTPFEGGWERIGDRVIFPILAPAEVVGRTIVLSVSLEEIATGDAAASDGGVTRVSLASARHTLTIVDALP